MSTLSGLFLTYGFTVMPGLATVDDYTFVSAFQGLERMFGTFDYGVNLPVLLGYAVGPFVIVLAIILNFRRPLRRWLIAALALVIVSVLVSQIFNVPLNNAIVSAGDPGLIDPTQVRLDFDEQTWRFWNMVRSATTLGAFMCSGWALYQSGRQTTTHPAP